MYELKTLPHKPQWDITTHLLKQPSKEKIT